MPRQRVRRQSVAECGRVWQSESVGSDGRSVLSGLVEASPSFRPLQTRLHHHFASLPVKLRAHSPQANWHRLQYLRATRPHLALQPPRSRHRPGSPSPLPADLTRSGLIRTTYLHPAKQLIIMNQNGNVQHRQPMYQRSFAPQQPSRQPYPSPTTQVPYQQPYKGTLAPGTRVQVGSITVTVKRYLSEGGFAHVYLVTSPQPIPMPTSVGGAVAASMARGAAAASRGETTHVLKRMAVPDKEALSDVRREVEVHVSLSAPDTDLVSWVAADISHCLSHHRNCCATSPTLFISSRHLRLLSKVAAMKSSS